MILLLLACATCEPDSDPDSDPDTQPPALDSLLRVETVYDCSEPDQDPLPLNSAGFDEFYALDCRRSTVNWQCHAGLELGYQREDDTVCVSYGPEPGCRLDMTEWCETAYPDALEMRVIITRIGLNPLAE